MLMPTIIMVLRCSTSNGDKEGDNTDDGGHICMEIKL